jgi:hypothetical protein
LERQLAGTDFGKGNGADRQRAGQQPRLDQRRCHGPKGYQGG